MIGNAIYLREQFAGLIPGEDYRFLRSLPNQNKILIVRFLELRKHPRAELLIVSASDFAREVTRGNIETKHIDNALPPWNACRKGVTLADLDETFCRRKRTYADHINSRILAMSTAITNPDDWMNAEDPERALNQLARDAGQHEPRFRNWVLSYLASGRDPLSICPIYHRAGCWERVGRNKQGRSSRAFGRDSGSGEDAALTRLYEDGYYRYVQLGRPLTQIYALIMARDLHCRVITDRKRHQVRFQPPPGQRIYTYEQFRYRIGKRVGRKDIQLNRYGRARHRTRNCPSEGPFTEKLANLMERVEADGQHFAERPRGYLEGSVLDPMVTVTAIDCLSGVKLGIGFALGAERSSAYRMLLFCMAIPKTLFCRLFGIAIEPWDWPSIGVPAPWFIDRGPGSAKNQIADFEKQFPIRDLAPSYSGQSKATVEGSHTKSDQIEGEPVYRASTLTPVQLARKAIYEVIRHNKAAFVENRIELNCDMVGITPCPNAVWDYFDSRLRNDAHPMSLDEAVRIFLTPTKFSVREDGVYLCGRRYNAQELRETGIFDRLLTGRSTTPTICGYVLDLCVRHAWVEVNGKVIMLDAQLKFRGDEEDLYVSMTELEQFAEARAKVHSEFRETQRAATSDIYQRFEEATGHSWASVRIRRGRPKKTAVAVQEQREASGRTQQENQP